MPVWPTIFAALNRQETCAMVSVVDVLGSAPRDVGARMVVRQDGAFTGTIGGGALEWRALASAQAAIAGTGGATVRLTREALGPDLGQCCGGSVQLMLEVFGPARLPEVAPLADAERAGPFVTQGRITDRRVIRTIVDGKLDIAAPALREMFGRQLQTLALFGAGHVGRALVPVLAPLDFRTVWIDPRAGAFPAAAADTARAVQSPDPVAELAHLPDGAFVLAMTHSHALDFDVVLGALRARRFAYIGLIGSATKRARFQSRLRQAGLHDVDIARMICPIGIVGITGKQPSAIAASVAADLLCRVEHLARESRNDGQEREDFAREVLGR